MSVRVGGGGGRKTTRNSLIWGLVASIAVLATLGIAVVSTRVGISFVAESNHAWRGEVRPLGAQTGAPLKRSQTAQSEELPEGKQTQQLLHPQVQLQPQRLLVSQSTSPLQPMAQMHHPRQQPTLQQPVQLTPKPRVQQTQPPASFLSERLFARVESKPVWDTAEFRAMALEASQSDAAQPSLDDALAEAGATQPASLVSNASSSSASSGGLDSTASRGVQVVIATFVNLRRADFGIMWARRCDRLGLRTFVVGALDGEALVLLRAHKIAAFLLDFTSPRQADRQGEGERGGSGGAEAAVVHGRQGAAKALPDGGREVRCCCQPAHLRRSCHFPSRALRTVPPLRDSPVRQDDTSRYSVVGALILGGARRASSGWASRRCALPADGAWYWGPTTASTCAGVAM